MGEHTWANRMGIEHCTTCGLCRRADGRNEPCRGKLPPIKPRESRRLVGWRVRYEYFNGSDWYPIATSMLLLDEARRLADRVRRSSGNVRCLHIMRVYRRSRR